MDKPTCSEDGCDGPVVARGLCVRDWQRWRKRQGPDYVKPVREKARCAVDDCPRIERSGGYCNRHYENFRRYGNPVPRKDRPLEVRLREVGWTVTESGCWEWDGKRNDSGYGIFNAERLGYVNARAHRVIYGHFVKPVPGELVLRHKCDNPPCVNPDHLIPGTPADNMADMVERDRGKRRGDACANGHDVTKPGVLRTWTAESGRIDTFCGECAREANARYRKRKREVPGHRPGKPGVPSRLSSQQVAEIRAKRAAGVKLRVLAGEYGVSVPYVCEITKGRYLKQEVA